MESAEAFPGQDASILPDHALEEAIASRLLLMPSPIFCVDAFTKRPFAGNPAAVCLIETARSDDWMQSVAAEMNLSETAFVGQRGNEFLLRWFTPKVEVDLCGHATLAASHVLWTERDTPSSVPIRFHTKSGVLTAARREGYIELDFPSEPASPTSTPDGLARALGRTPVLVGRNRMDYLVELESEDAVRTLQPDFKALAAVDTRGVIVTAPSASPGSDFVSRFFAPRVGIDEDPVTGSAHCMLGPWFQARLGDRIRAHQASARGGRV
ncbi:MAG TPA: PhzF family phenazine biosynthesis protein, partial [Vicinamibacterales bacterium]|nr:PhzF family phenazine biosynthesis protein [Vicinamibacterales bacterium]